MQSYCVHGEWCKHAFLRICCAVRAGYQAYCQAYWKSKSIQNTPVSDVSTTIMYENNKLCLDRSNLFFYKMHNSKRIANLILMLSIFKKAQYNKGEFQWTSWNLSKKEKKLKMKFIIGQVSRKFLIAATFSFVIWADWTQMILVSIYFWKILTMNFDSWIFDLDTECFWAFWNFFFYFKFLFMHFSFAFCNFLNFKTLVWTDSYV